MKFTDSKLVLNAEALAVAEPLTFPGDSERSLPSSRAAPVQPLTRAENKALVALIADYRRDNKRETRVWLILALSAAAVVIWSLCI